MELLLPVLGIVYGSLFIWLTVRVVNQPAQWRRVVRVAFLWLAPLILVPCLLSMIDSAGHRTASQRSQCKNNMKQIGLALHNYADMYGSFPPAYIADENGRPMHSWRVLILLFLDEAPLYSQYRFDEPWDGPNNSKLASTILAVFNCPSDDHGGTGNTSTMTNYVAIVGPETAWPDGGAATIHDISDGTSSTLQVVEVANSGIHWMEPRDLHVVQMAPTVNAKAGQGISSRHTGGAHGLIADGAVRFVPERVSVDDLRAWLTAHAGDKSSKF
jgi:hypothetical protein